MKFLYISALLLILFIAATSSLNCDGLCDTVNIFSYTECDNVCSCHVDDGDSCNDCCDGDNDCEDFCNTIDDIGTGDEPDCNELCNFLTFYGYGESECDDACGCVFDDGDSCSECCNGDSNCLDVCEDICRIYDCPNDDDNNDNDDNDSPATILIPTLTFFIALITLFA